MFQKKNLLALGVSALCLGLVPQAQAFEAGDWLIRAKATEIQTANESDPIPALGIQRDEIHVSDEWMPEVNITYFLNSNWALELVLTIPQEHEVTLNNNAGTTQLGTFKHLPPVLSAQYHFDLTPTIKPYVGAGLNYTRIGSVNLNSPAGPLDLESDSMGLALGAGVDVDLGNNLYFNFDVKKVQIRSDVRLKADGSKVGHVKVDPLLVGLGVGWRF